MGSSLRKGANVSLTGNEASLSRVLVGIGWTPGPRARQPLDLDASAVLVGPDGKVPNDAHFVFYNQLGPPDKPSPVRAAPGAAAPGAAPTDPGALDLAGLGASGGGVGAGGRAGGAVGLDGEDAEQVEVDLLGVPGYVDKIAFAVSIYQANARRQTFGDLRAAHIRVLSLDTGAEVARYDLDLGGSTETAVVFGELYRHGGGWKFRAVGQGWVDGLVGIARSYGVSPG